VAGGPQTTDLFPAQKGKTSVESHFLSRSRGGGNTDLALVSNTKNYNKTKKGNGRVKSCERGKAFGDVRKKEPA